MPIQTVNLDKVEKQLAELLAIVEQGGEIVIAQNGKTFSAFRTCYAD
jgi:antitoxin (DNA-binding transcriptional repressor) of toxin-antitoxin stability system